MFQMKIKHVSFILSEVSGNISSFLQFGHRFLLCIMAKRSHKGKVFRRKLIASDESYLFDGYNNTQG